MKEFNQQNNSQDKQIELSKLQSALEAAKGKGISSSQLKKVCDFVEYLEMVRLFSKRYTLFIAVNDTPCGPNFTEELAFKIMKLGLKENLYQKFRHSYVAVIDSGDLLFEKLSPTIYESVEYNCVLNNVELNIVSGGFNSDKKSIALVNINGKNHSINKRGLNFVVYDKVTGEVLDAVNFDTFNSNCKYYRPDDLREGILEYKNSHPNISLLHLVQPLFPKDNLSEYENFIKVNSMNFFMILQNLDKPIFSLNQYLKTKEEIIEVLTPPKSYHNVHGVRQFEDVRGKCVNTCGGIRVTVAQPAEYKRSVFIVGGCSVFGVGATDKGTIASHLQELFTRLLPDEQIIVHNYGYYLCEIDATSNEELAILNSLPVKPGDIVICCFGQAQEEIPFLDLSELFYRPHNYEEPFFDLGHFTESGYGAIAKELFKELSASGFLKLNSQYQQKNSISAVAKGGHVNAYPFDSQASAELLKYQNILREFYEEMFALKMGAIVVNCNPFTNGHLYLIETAASQVDHLFVFVVQENLSIFPFDDRLRLVDEGVAHLKNITVIPSGRFIISSLTFSEYFNKSELQEHTIDSSLDITIFAREIAPSLNIRVRFAGEEPHDNVTNQYNQTMRTILPQYGIKFVEIPRKEMNGKPISASYVRSLLKENNFEEIEKIVPKTTLDYLLNEFQKVSGGTNTIM